MYLFTNTDKKIPKKIFFCWRFIGRKFSSINHFPKYEGLKITRILAYQVDLPLHDGKSYNWSGGNSISVFDSTVVEIETNLGITGYGENTPLGAGYLPAYAPGTRAGIKQLGPSLIGQDPTRLHQINETMDHAMRGHPYVKSAIDMACWDILGKVANLPVCELLGGRFGDSFPLYRTTSKQSAREMSESVDSFITEGYRIFQLKLGDDVREDVRRIRSVRALLDEREDELGIHIPLLCDANTGWSRFEAMQVVNAVKDLNIILEQPCLSYEECLSVRQHCSLPFLIDENMDSVHMLVRIISDRAADAINIKISKVGGLTKAKLIRDLAVSAGIVMNIEDTWGGDIVTAAISHLAHSTPPKLLLCSTDFNSYGPVEMALTTAHRHNGRLAAPTSPGLGVVPRFDVLGSPVLEIN